MIQKGTLCPEEVEMKNISARLSTSYGSPHSTLSTIGRKQKDKEVMEKAQKPQCGAISYY